MIGREATAVDRYIKNFAKTLELIQATFTLKEAYLQAKHPDLTKKEIAAIMYQNILKRKERQWKSQKGSLKP